MKYELGQRIQFSRCYKVNPRSRMPGENGKGKGAIPIENGPTSGIVVGKRSCVMGDWTRGVHYVTAGSLSPPEEIGIRLDGHRQTMLLVAHNLLRKMVLVAPEDIVENDSMMEEARRHPGVAEAITLYEHCRPITDAVAASQAAAWPQPKVWASDSSQPPHEHSEVVEESNA
jgi:hypothetical protein